MAWRLLGARPLPEPILAYCELDSNPKKMHLKMSSAKAVAILSRTDDCPGQTVQDRRHCTFISANSWVHNAHDGVLNHQPRNCLPNRLFKQRSRKISKLRVTGRGPVNSAHKRPVTRNMSPFDDIIMHGLRLNRLDILHWYWSAGLVWNQNIPEDIRPLLPYTE